MEDLPRSKPDTILVVNGDVTTRSAIADYLRHCGYRVIEAKDALAAQEALVHSGFYVDTILSDVDLPGGTNGFQLAAWVRENRGGIKVVLSSAERTAKAAGDLCEDGPRIAKPYDLAILLARIRRLKGWSCGDLEESS
ncbi:MAG: response regulator [Mesorhizobium sp.]|nr:MAG: response regulator [Mesorhizobium sp.]